MILIRQMFMRVSCCLLLTWLLAQVKISFLVGTQMASFSLAHCLTPLIGLLAGGIGATAFFAARTVFNSGSLILACHLPTFGAALYLSALTTTNYNISLGKKLVLAAIPLGCMLLFILHPVGYAAFVYSLFWLIPLASLAIPHNNLFFHMLGSTFTAHAIGSVLWLYAGLIPDAHIWINLIPVVIIERLLFASGMFVGYNIIITAKKAVYMRKIFTLLSSNKA